MCNYTWPIIWYVCCDVMICRLMRTLFLRSKSKLTFTKTQLLTLEEQMLGNSLSSLT